MTAEESAKERNYRIEERLALLGIDKGKETLSQRYAAQQEADEAIDRIELQEWKESKK